MNCKFCNTKLLMEAKFCHNCGSPVIHSKTCAACGKSNPFKAMFCFNCGHAFESIDSKETLTSKDQFLLILEKEVQVKHGYVNSERIKERFASPKYKDVFNARFSQLDQEQNQSLEYAKSELEVRHSLVALLEFFLVMYCKDLLPFTIDEKILRYQHVKYPFDLQQLAEDYLQLSDLEEDIYYSLIDIDFDKLEHATEFFFFPESSEHLLFIIDLSISGNLIHGLAVTDQGLYWKLPLQTSHKVKFTDILKLEIDKACLIINDKYFDINPAFNFRFRRFLQRMALLNYGDTKKRNTI